MMQAIKEFMQAMEFLMLIVENWLLILCTLGIMLVGLAISYGLKKGKQS